MSILSRAINRFAAVPTARLPGQWDALQIFNTTRLFLAFSLWFMYHFDVAQIAAGDRYPELSTLILLLYCVFSFVACVCAWQRIIRFERLVLQQTLIDILFLTILLQTMQTIGAGLGVLLNIVIAAGSVLLPGRYALLFASSAVVFLWLAQWVGMHLTWVAVHDQWLWLILNFSFFATAGLATIFSNKANAQAEKTVQRDRALKQLSRLNERIIHHLQAGVMVIDAMGCIRLMNTVARRYLKLESSQDPGMLAEAMPKIASYYRRWLDNPALPKDTFKFEAQGRECLVHFDRLDDAAESDTLILIEDMAFMQQQAQQLKLASLGRFTASMAHELRNPLGAISHAAQLLAEESSRSTGEARLIEIIATQTDRMNRVIKNILQLSRRTASAPTTLDLKVWLTEFIESFVTQSPEAVELSVDPIATNLQVRFDPSQLQQVLINLCENGLRFNHAATGQWQVRLCAGMSALQQPYLEVRDRGQGVSSENRARLFEPFYTTDRQGTGLGLYLAYELCQANQATLSYARAQAETCFRITFNQVT